MESLIARIDHERRAYRDRNEFLEEENSKLEKELAKFKKVSQELDKSLSKAEEMREKYQNVSMMQLADFESLRLRNSERHTKYLKLRTKYDDLKHEMHQMFKEQYIVNATNKEETFKKEERLLKMARKINYAGSDN